LGTVPFALGNKIIHPYSDFMLHDVGTNDPIVQTQHAQFPPRGVENLRRIPQEFLIKEDAEGEEGVLRIMRRQVPKAKDAAKKGAPQDQEECQPTEEEIHLDQRTLNKVRTAPLWGLRVRPQLLHDGSALTIEEAIRKHTVNAGAVVLPGNFDMLPADQKEKLLAFLKSL
jgi:Di-haem oxidoreductase, putative peroxidase